MLSRNLHVSHANSWWSHLATLDIPVLHYTFTVCVWVNKQPCCDLTRWAPHELPCSLAEMFCRRLRWMEVRGQFHIRPHCYWGKRFQYFLSRRLLGHPLTLWRKFSCPCLESNQPRFFCSIRSLVIIPTTASLLWSLAIVILKMCGYFESFGLIWGNIRGVQRFWAES